MLRIGQDFEATMFEDSLTYFAKAETVVDLGVVRGRAQRTVISQEHCIALMASNGQPPSLIATTGVAIVRRPLAKSTPTLTFITTTAATMIGSRSCAD